MSTLVSFHFHITAVGRKMGTLVSIAAKDVRGVLELIGDPA